MSLAMSLRQNENKTSKRVKASVKKDFRFCLKLLYKNGKIIR